MDYKRKIRRNQIITAIILISIIVGCGMLIGFRNMYKSILFILPFFILLPIGDYYIIMRFEGRSQFLLFAFWFSFVSFITALIGMLIDSRASNVEWKHIFTVAGIVGLATTLFVFIMTPVFAAIYRFWRKG